MNRITVVITTYNRARQLRQSLRSLAAQTRLPDQVIIADDCSNDDTQRVAAEFEHAFPSLVYSRGERNCGMPGNLNRGLRQADGDYIANLHDADEFHPELIAEWEAALNRHPSAGFVFCGVGAVNDASFATIHSVASLENGRSFFHRHFLHKYASIVWGTVMVRKAAYADALPFDSRYGFISDVDMWMRLSMKWDVAYVARPLILLDHSPADTRGWVWKHKDASRRMQRDNLKRFFAEDPKRMRLELRRARWVALGMYTRGILAMAIRLRFTKTSEGLRYMWSFICEDVVNRQRGDLP